MVLMSGGFVINDVVWELHETTLGPRGPRLDFDSPLWYYRGVISIHKALAGLDSSSA